MTINIKMNALDRKVKEFPRKEAECITDTVDRFYATLNLPDRRLLKNFEVLVDGHFLPKEDWKTFIPNKDSVLLIALVPAGGSGRVTARTIIILAAVAVASYFSAGAFSAPAASAAAGALAGAAASFAATAILNSLMPLPVESLSIGGITSEDESQTYSITSQANSIKKFGAVPKVYGMQKVYPYVAATPYTALDVDKDTGDTIQYFHAVYDFGIGHYDVGDIQIGDTPIGEFIDASFSIVDLNDPLENNGSWDEEYVNTLQHYSGDVAQSDVGAVLNENQLTPGTDLDACQATRFADLPEGYDQTTTLTFVCPSGLFGIDSSNNHLERTIDLTIEFAEVGTEDWKSFSDAQYSKDYDVVGGTTKSASWQIGVAVQARASDFDTYLPYWSLIKDATITYSQWAWDIYGFYGGNPDQVLDQRTYGYKKGDYHFYTPTPLEIGTVIKHMTTIGTILSSEAVPGTILVKNIMDKPFPYSIKVFRQYSYASYTPFVHFLHSTISIPNFVLTSAEASGGLFRINSDLDRAVFSSVSFKPRTTNQIKLRVTRTRDYGPSAVQTYADLTWLYLTTRLDKNPIRTTKSHTFIELKVRATDQLNGAINNLSAIVTSALDVWDGSAWVKQLTNNPAWIFVDILTGEMNKNAISKDRLDLDSIVEWANYCDEIPTSPPPPQTITFVNNRFTANHILDYNTTVQDFINKVTSSANASLNIIGGKYGVLIDKDKTVPVQVFTPRNSWGFSSTKGFNEPPHALKVAYIDSGTTWEQKEQVVYSDGYDIDNSDIFEEVKTFGCINYEQAWRFGRYILAQGILRQETINITTDFEYLVCNRGDYVLFQHDAMRAGGRPARVKTVVGNTITIDDAFITSVGINYGYTVRRVDGAFTSTMTITDSYTADLDGELPSVGDLIVWGEVDRITIDCIIKAITPNSDLTAGLTLVEKAEAIYEAETLGILPGYDATLSTNLDTDVLPPGKVADLQVVENTWKCQNGDYLYYILVSWSAPIGVVDVYEVYLDNGLGYKLAGYTTALSYQVDVATNNLGVEHRVKIIGVAANGLKRSLGEVDLISATPISKITPPSDVDAVYINILNETLQLDWDSIPDCDTNNYLIRFSPSLTGTWSTSIPLQTVDRYTSLASFQARTGTYLIKAIDWNGNESTNAATAITSIPNLVNLNIIEETNDFPALLGNTDRVTQWGSSLLLQEKASGTPGVIEYYPEGYYYFKDFLDLGEIYTVRLQSLIEAEGYTIDDLMVNWLVLSDVTFMTTTSTSAWNVESQYRSTDVYLVMGEWATLSAVDPISEGQQENWTPWRRFTIGDFTARTFQFRLKLISNVPSISPRIIDGVIRSDMPDRRESYNNIIVGLSGNNIVYSPAFAGPGTTPAIQITQDDASQGDYYKLTNKTLNGFTITMYDKTDTIVSRQIDAEIVGYGRKNAVVI